ncbi:hypothetical protein BC629DRAFT_971719 [Irpex lacteus]|nr:hypothetical protein BC629DRAFT_971719 [Irpex lacteus]
MSNDIPSPRVWFITGSSSGFGRCVTELALKKGDQVVATLRKPDALKDLQDNTPSEQLLVIKVDVTKEKDITNAFLKAKEKFGRIDVVYNNAGYGMGSVVESAPDDVARDVFEANFWGAARVNTAALRFFRDENPAGAGGRLIVSSSLAGLHPLANMGHYSAAKHALEALTQAMADEIDPDWNVKISLIEFGTFRTPALGKVAPIPLPEAYKSPNSGVIKAEKLYDAADTSQQKIGDPRKAAAKVYELSNLENPPLRLLLGQDTLQYVRRQLDRISSDAEGYSSWSTDILEQ